MNLPRSGRFRCQNPGSNALKMTTDRNRLVPFTLRLRLRSSLSLHSISYLYYSVTSPSSYKDNASRMVIILHDGIEHNL